MAKTYAQQVRNLAKRLIYGLLPLLALSACMHIPSRQQRVDTANALALAKGWHGQQIETGRFRLAAYHRPKSQPGSRLTIYLEGDGLAWISRTTPSDDPTPINPVGLKLALAQPDGQVAYLARPCQYTNEVSPRCRQAYWTSARFSEEVIAAVDNAISQLAQQFQASKLTLVGYSGGGAVAALVAARRHDVDRLLTVAGNLDIVQWTSITRSSPLSNSLNPADAAGELQQVRQWHFSGGDDAIVPLAVTRSYADRFPLSNRPGIDTIAGYGHQCCWVDNWPSLLQRVPFWSAF